MRKVELARAFFGILCEMWLLKIEKDSLRISYCWWTKSCTTNHDDYPIIHRVLPSQVVQDFVHQQYLQSFVWLSESTPNGSVPWWDFWGASLGPSIGSLIQRTHDSMVVFWFPLIGGRGWYNPPIGSIYHLYIAFLGGYMLPIPPVRGNQKQGHALVKARGLLGSVCVWLTSLLWCFDMCYWRPLFLARPATNLVSKFWPVPLWSLRFLASGSARPKHRGKWRFFHCEALDMCEVCTEAVHSVALWTRVTLGLRTCVHCHSVALWTQVTLQVCACVECVPKQSIP